MDGPFCFKTKGNTTESQGVACRRIILEPRAFLNKRYFIFLLIFICLSAEIRLVVCSRGVAERGFELGKKLDEELVGIAGLEAGLGGWNSWCVMEQVGWGGLQ